LGTFKKLETAGAGFQEKGLVFKEMSLKSVPERL
jgi:hypothetical protein